MTIFTDEQYCWLHAGVKNSVSSCVSELKGLAPLGSRVEWLEWWSRQLERQRTLLKQLYISISG